MQLHSGMVLDEVSATLTDHQAQVPVLSCRGVLTAVSTEHRDGASFLCAYSMAPDKLFIMLNSRPQTSSSVMSIHEFFPASYAIELHTSRMAADGL
jgi:hypothetical protein